MSLLTWIKTIVNKFATSNHTALISDEQVLRSYLKLICECELHSLPHKKVSGAEDHGINYIKVRPPLVRHLLRNRLLAPRFCRKYCNKRRGACLNIYKFHEFFVFTKYLLILSLFGFSWVNKKTLWSLAQTN